MSNLRTPLLFLTFNRPEPTRRVFEEIRKARPEKLFISADGPRPDRPDDVEKCKKVREIVSHVDWPCEVKTLFRDKNLGCKIGASSAITWFFDNVEEGIILEDDCVPDQSFFPFCEELLARFRNDERISLISGQIMIQNLDIPYSYTFTKFAHLWGWASWRRSWKHYDVTMKVWGDKRNRKMIKRAMNDPLVWNYKEWLYDETYHGRKDTWDYQWESYRLLHGQISIIPSINLIENVGFGPDATHTTQEDSPFILSRGKMSFPLIHNSNIQADNNYDLLFRPPIPARSMRMRIVNQKIKAILSFLLPKTFYEKILNRRKSEI